MNQMSVEIEKNIESREETDRVMWFSMWVLLSVASFGIAWFLMIYFLIKRRNDHFSRQEKLETLISNRLRRRSEENLQKQNTAFVSVKIENAEIHRNAQAWALSTLLVFPAFYIFYFLENDLQKHEEHEYTFFTETILRAQDYRSSLNLQGFTATKKFALDRYLLLTIATCAFAAVYWLYWIFNDYNQHFKRQWKIEDDLVMLIKSIEK